MGDREDTVVTNGLLSIGCLCAASVIIKHLFTDNVKKSSLRGELTMFVRTTLNGLTGPCKYTCQSER